MAQLLEYHLDLAPDSRWNYYSALPETKASLLYLQEAGDFYAGTGYYTKREGLASYLLKLTVSGCGRLTYGGKRYRLTAGRFFLIDCQQHQDYRTEPGVGNWHVLWFHFYGPAAAFYYDAFLQQTDGSPTAGLTADSPVYAMLEQLLRLEPEKSGQLELDLEAASLLTQILTQCVLAARQPLQRQIPALILQIRTYLTQNYAQKLTLQTLSAKFGLSPCYLQRLFKRYVGQSPTDYLIYLRMNQAKKLMRTTGMSISEISYSVGIENLGYFTRQFRRQEGQTPQQYRKQLILPPESGGARSARQDSLE